MLPCVKYVYIDKKGVKGHPRDGKKHKEGMARGKEPKMRTFVKPAPGQGSKGKKGGTKWV